MPAGSWKLAPGLNHVGAFQVSGAPFVSGSCVAPKSGSSLVVRFPYVTNWFMIEPHSGSTQSVRVAFSEQGLYSKGASGTAAVPGKVGDGYNFRVHVSSSFKGRLDLKVSELWFMSEDSANFTFDLMAGLTNIPGSRTSTETSASAAGLWNPDGAVEAGGPNWSGSVGVG
jgi:hypothetical protein